MLSYIVRGTLTFPIIVSVLGLATAVIIVMVRICLGAAVAMVCTIIAGSIVCFSLFWFCVP